MTTVSTDYIWQAILESERSDDIQFIDNKLPIEAEAARSAQQEPDQPGTLNGDPAAVESALIAPNKPAASRRAGVL